MRIGQGFDVHQLVEGRPLILGESQSLMKKDY
ncbi:2-C-methyl-D-erythritol 2,4-cyclodiphosphate synthase [Halalkalibacter krulwichiae]|uniref:2-C-methyl-D-erythritol 2,4-cyclodiphosphate synthase n=1 Tax=Halalkalibacter krulwichiae TaxID=199441 RepID=A0A1X9M792_9BACI|nr:2-C-methyl-D-erythritol 2,4-cyclodiphosphate synthase [Halalkalibacter krulwichiae]